jgi:hypothetical protein
VAGLLEFSVGMFALLGFGVVRSMKYVHPKSIAADKANAMSRRF